MASLKRIRGGNGNQLQIAAQGRYRLEGWSGAILIRAGHAEAGPAVHAGGPFSC
jgi:hypothetical protein